MEQSQKEQYLQILSRYIPASAVDRVFAFMDQHQVHLHITRKRTSKLGDYSWPQPHHPYQEISFNGDMNSYKALTVLLHEMAHLLTHQFYGNGVQPHGHEWQGQYRQLLHDYQDCFPHDIQSILVRYMRRIPLSRVIEKELDAQLRTYDADYDASNTLLTLNDLEPGTLFRIASKPHILFRAIEKRRTRWICADAQTQAKYLVSGGAEVVVEQA